MKSNATNWRGITCTHQHNKRLTTTFPGVNAHIFRAPIVFFTLEHLTDSYRASKAPTQSSTFEGHGSNPLLESRSLPSFFDDRTFPILNWDRAQTRNAYYVRKPFQNVAPLPRAQQISGYSGSIGGANLQDIDNPSVNFQPYTVLRTEQPKVTINS